MRDAINRADAKGHLFVAEVGNGGKDGVGDNNDSTPEYPASYKNANIISVAATDDEDALASFSNIGASTVDLAASGVNIKSTLPGNCYGSYSATSMATPHVTGAAALIKTQRPALDDGQRRAQILKFAESKSNLQGKVATGGRLNANASLMQAPVSDYAGPTVASAKPSPCTRDRTPTVTATVRDDRTELSESNISFFLDGQERRDTFSYDADTDRLTYNCGRGSIGNHTVTITATNAAGNDTTKTWTFKVVRR